MNLARRKFDTLVIGAGGPENRNVRHRPVVEAGGGVEGDGALEGGEAVGR